MYRGMRVGVCLFVCMRVRAAYVLVFVIFKSVRVRKLDKGSGKRN